MRDCNYYTGCLPGNRQILVIILNKKIDLVIMEVIRPELKENIIRDVEYAKAA